MKYDYRLYEVDDKGNAQINEHGRPNIKPWIESSEGGRWESELKAREHLDSYLRQHIESESFYIHRLTAELRRLNATMEQYQSAIAFNRERIQELSSGV